MNTKKKCILLLMVGVLALTSIPMLEAGKKRQEHGAEFRNSLSARQFNKLSQERQKEIRRQASTPSPSAPSDNGQSIDQSREDDVVVSPGKEEEEPNRQENRVLKIIDCLIKEEVYSSDRIAHIITEEDDHDVLARIIKSINDLPNTNEDWRKLLNEEETTETIINTLSAEFKWRKAFIAGLLATPKSIQWLKKKCNGNKDEKSNQDKMHSQMSFAFWVGLRAVEIEHAKYSAVKDIEKRKNFKNTSVLTGLFNVFVQSLIDAQIINKQNVNAKGLHRTLVHNTLLMTACSTGSVQLAQKLLSMMPATGIKDCSAANAWTDYFIRPLSCALERTSEHQGEMVQLLLKHNADPNFFSAFFGSPLDQAVGQNKIKIVQLLLQKTDTKSLLNEALVGAAFRDADIEITQQLLDAGADVNFHDEYGKTSLEWAVKCGHNTMAQLLLNHPKITTDSIQEALAKDS